VLTGCCVASLIEELLSIDCARSYSAKATTTNRRATRLLLLYHQDEPPALRQSLIVFISQHEQLGVRISSLLPHFKVNPTARFIYLPGQVSDSTQHCPHSTTRHSRLSSADSTQLTPPSTTAAVYPISALLVTVTFIDAARGLATLNPLSYSSQLHA